MTDYITPSEFRTRHGITAVAAEEVLSDVVTEASRMVDSICGRTFGSVASSARVFRPTTSTLVYIDDAVSVSAVATDEADDGTYSTSWSSGDWQVEPLNGIGPNGQTGWPIIRLRAVESRYFPITARRASVQVTGVWGWAAVPADVKAATFLLANRIYAERDAPMGVVGSTEFGALPLRDQRTAMKLLHPFTRRPVLVA